MNKSRNVLLSALIRKRRKELNWKQESLINGIPISVSYYSEIERGNRAIPSDLLNSLLEKLQLPLLSDIWYADFSNKINLLKKYLYYCTRDANQMENKVKYIKNINVLSFDSLSISRYFD